APGVALLDLATGRRDEVQWPAPKPDFFGPRAELSATADGRYLVFVAEKGAGAETVWWGREAHRTAGRFPGLEPLDLAPGDRWLTKGDRTGEISIRAAASAQELLRLPRSDEFFRFLQHNSRRLVSFTSNGDYLLIYAGQGSDIIEAATGRTCAHLPTDWG